MRIHPKAIAFLVLDIFIFLFWYLLKDSLLLGLGLSILIFILFEALLTYISIAGIDVKRYSRTNRHKVGDVFKETFEIMNNSRFRKYLIQLIDESKTGGKINSRVITNFPSKGKRSYRSSTILLGRGIFELGPTVVRAESMFGLFSSSRVFPAKKRLIVFPNIVELERIEERSSVDMGGKNVWSYSAKTTPQIAGIREYFPGDPLHRVHWPLSLKHDRLVVKEFDEDSRAQTWILLDAGNREDLSTPDRNVAEKTPFMTLKRSNHRSYLPKNSFEYAVCIAASLAEYYTRKGISVGLTTVGRNVINIQPDSGQRQLMKILSELSTLENIGGLDIGSLFDRVKFQIPKGAKVFLISDEEQIDMYQLLKRAALKKITLIPVYINSASFRGVSSTNKKFGFSSDATRTAVTVNYMDDIKTVLEKEISKWNY